MTDLSKLTDSFWIGARVTTHLGPAGRVNQWLKLIGPLDTHAAADPYLIQLSDVAREYDLHPSQLQVIRRKGSRRGLLNDYFIKDAENVSN